MLRLMFQTLLVTIIGIYGSDDHDTWVDITIVNVADMHNGLFIFQHNNNFI